MGPLKLNLPNQITLVRLLLAVVFFILLSQYQVDRTTDGTMIACLTVFIVASLTDWLDGYLARKYEQITSLGRVLDPFVDKVLICGAYIYFAGPGFVTNQLHSVSSVTPWMVVIIIGRELLVTLLRSYAESRGEAFGADGLGKLKTVLQMIAAVAVMLFAIGKDMEPWTEILRIIKVTLVWSAVGITAVSGLHYVIKAKQLLIDRPVHQ